MQGQQMIPFVYSSKQRAFLKDSEKQGQDSWVLISLLIIVKEENNCSNKSHCEGSFSFRDLQEHKHQRLRFRMLNTQIKDNLFPKVTAEIISLQSKGFTKQRKHITKHPKR